MLKSTPSRSARKLATKLAHISVVIADPDIPIAKLVREVLKTAGFTNVQMAKDGQEALHIIRYQEVDLLITDWRMQPTDGVSLIQYLRRDPASPNRFLPIIMLTGKAEVKNVELARDSGVTEYLIKPFTANSLFERIVKMIENPRSYIVSKTYSGPDRRRRQLPIATEDDRRKSRPAQVGKVPPAIPMVKN